MNHKIFIATPCFEFKVNAYYTQSLLDFVKNGIDFEVFFLHDSLITRSRNELITKFYENSEKYTHLLWLDSDIAIPTDGLIKLIDEKVDVIAAAIPIKNKEPNNHQSIRKTYEEIKPYLYKAEAAATGCLLMSKKSAVSLIENAEYYYIDDISTRKIYNVFETGIRNNQLMSEDWDICYKLRDLGYEIYVDSSFSVSHFGTYNYSRGPMLNLEMSKMLFSYD